MTVKKLTVVKDSFTTPFFIPLEKFLEEDPELETPKAYGEYLSRPMQCWRCGKNFDNKFAELKVRFLPSCCGNFRMPIMTFFSATFGDRVRKVEKGATSSRKA